MPLRRSFYAGLLLSTAIIVAVRAELRPADRQSQPTNGALQDTRAVTLPRYADLPPASKRVSAEGDYERARTDESFQLLRVTYISDGLPVVAFIYRAVATKTPSPVIVFNRGSWIRQNAAPELLVTFHRLARGGFVIVAPMYRGSEGAPGRDELGGADLADLMNVQKVVSSLPYADASQLFLYGESRGGMMVLQAIRDGFPARAAATVGAFTDLEQASRDDPQSAAVGPQIWPDYEANRDAIIERRSALRWADRLTVPLLIMHGRDDPQIQPSHAWRLADALHRHGAQYELVIAAGARHALQPFEAERDERTIRWFRRHLATAHR